MRLVKSAIDKILPYILQPLSWFYGAAVWVRNKLFDSGLLPVMEYDVPVVGIGNITVGGTGKTPHTEYLLNSFSTSCRVAVLSRGYKRKTKGFIIANSKSTPETIGDEPWQIYNKFGSLVKVAVCESRRKGISQLLTLYPDLELIILDDSFQHRWVKPRISILLMEYGRMINKDHLLPYGRLREQASEIDRADKVIVTKCPESISPIDLRIVTKELNLLKFQKIYFSRYSYEGLKPVFPDESKFAAPLYAFNENDAVLLLTGIAHPRYFVRHFKGYPFNKKVLHFSDHHDFSRKDILAIEQRFRLMKGERKIIITTEKDAVRLAFNPYFPHELKPYIFYQPISVKMIEGPYGHDNDLVKDLMQELRLGDIASYVSGNEDKSNNSGFDRTSSYRRHEAAEGRSDVDRERYSEQSFGESRYENHQYIDDLNEQPCPDQHFNDSEISEFNRSPISHDNEEEESRHKNGGDTLSFGGFR